MFGRDSEDETWSRFLFELVIWTQPSGPLCLWQCFDNSWKKDLCYCSPWILISWSCPYYFTFFSIIGFIWCCMDNVGPCHNSFFELNLVNNWHIFIGPRSDHSLPISLTDWLTDSLTDWRPFGTDVTTLLKMEWIDPCSRNQISKQCWYWNEIEV